MSLGQNTNKDTVKEERYSIGISTIDKDVLNGVPKGSTISVLGDPMSAGEMVTQSLATTGRETLYITTLRPKMGIMEDIVRVNENRNNGINEDEIRDKVTIKECLIDDKDDNYYDNLMDNIKNMPEEGNFIIDAFPSHSTINSYEMQQIISEIYSRTRENNSLSYIYIVSESRSNISEWDKYLLYTMDGVFDIKTTYIGNDKIQTDMFVSKLRGVDLPNDSQTLEFGEGLTVDVTDDIG